MSLQGLPHSAGHSASRSPASTVAKKAACDRCRGQKLRCIWDDDAVECRRCIRAQAVCAMAPSRPIGRPPKRVRSTRSCSPPTVMPSYHPHAPSGMATDQDMEDHNISRPESSHGGAHDALHDLFLDPFLSELLGGQSTRDSDFDPGQFLLSPSALVQDTVGSQRGADNPSASTRPSSETREMSSTDSGSATISEDAEPASLDVMDQLAKMNRILYEHASRLAAATQALSTSKKTYRPVAQLGVGQILSVTHEFKALADRLGLPLPGSSDKRRAENSTPCDHATALQLLSCYLRLKKAQSRTMAMIHSLEQLLERTPSTPILDMVPDLVIDGFSLAGHPGLQLELTKKICEERFAIIGSIPIFEGHVASTSLLDWGDIGACLENLRKIC
ncbi:hypothetical protein GQ53DRAFT_744943 [Thozetella sp. PMI_491]|nr:hypothetical protein GQ53DRAFT_744943 [Thozetella sp. PMI_491]